MAIKRIRVNTDDEKDLITGLIISNEFCRRVLPMVHADHLESSGTRRLFLWIQDYHDRYGKAPGREIQTIFKVERKNLSDHEVSEMDRILTHLQDRYDEKEFNWEYHQDIARDFIRHRTLDILMDTVKVMKDRGDLAKAESVVRNFTATSQNTSQWMFPLVDKTLQYRILDRQDKGGPFRLDGAAGQVFGDWQYGWLIAFIGPPKRGKTWMLSEVALQALVQGLKVIFISLEMNEDDMGYRFMRMASNLPEKSGKIKIPIWDCASNQNDSCQLKERTNHKKPPKNAKGIVEFREGDPYEPCTFCKTNLKLLNNYKAASWFRLEVRRNTFVAKAIETIEAFAMQYHGGNLSMRCFPRFSASIEDIDAAIEEIIQNKKWIPNMIIIDYAGILKEEVGTGGSDWQVHDVTWKKLARLASERKVILVSAGQGNAKSMSSRSMSPDQIAGYTGLNAHVDVGISLNQLGKEDDNERKAMVMRLGTLAMRHGAWPSEEVYILQSLDTGNPAIDSFAMSVQYKLLETPKKEGRADDV